MRQRLLFVPPQLAENSAGCQRDAREMGHRLINSVGESASTMQNPALLRSHLRERRGSRIAKDIFRAQPWNEPRLHARDDFGRPGFSRGRNADS